MLLVKLIDYCFSSSRKRGESLIVVNETPHHVRDVQKPQICLVRLDHIYSFNKLAANIIFSESTGACVLNFALSSLHEISFEPVNATTVWP